MAYLHNCRHDHSAPELALAVIRARRQAEGLATYPGQRAMGEAARELWNDEHRTWEALSGVGLHAAADCAWRRRVAAVRLTMIVNAAG